MKSICFFFLVLCTFSAYAQKNTDFFNKKFYFLDNIINSQNKINYKWVLSHHSCPLIKNQKKVNTEYLTLYSPQNSEFKGREIKLSCVNFNAKRNQIVISIEEFSNNVNKMSKRIIPANLLIYKEGEEVKKFNAGIYFNMGKKYIVISYNPNFKNTDFNFLKGKKIHIGVESNNTNKNMIFNINSGFKTINNFIKNCH